MLEGRRYTQVSNITDEVIVADIDDEVTNVETEQHSRPSRDNAGAGVERLQIDFHGKGYGRKEEFNFVTNSET